MKVYAICVKLAKDKKIRTKNICQWGNRNRFNIYASVQAAQAEIPLKAVGDFVIKRFTVF